MEELVGKTIKKIEFPDRLEITDGTFTIKRSDGYKYENIVITFTDGTILKLASWDYESYASGIYKEVVVPHLTN